MAKKSFKSGLDNLLASAGIIKKTDAAKNEEDKLSAEKIISDEEKHWMLIKIENLNKELALWRTGKLSVVEFQESLKQYGLIYHAGTNEIVEK